MGKKKLTDESISVSEAAQRLGVDESHVRRLARTDKLAARRWGRDWMISAVSVASYAKTSHPPGRKPANRNGSGQSVRP